jgi:mannose-6-phosphate isomerase-like protein (cupin superfamily)
VEFIKKDEIKTFHNEGFASHQLIFPENSASERVTITRVLVQPGASNQRHHHVQSEQIWVALQGCGDLLLANNETRRFESGDVVRFADGDIHGLHNTSDAVFEYLAITAPPINFRSAYKREQK